MIQAKIRSKDLRKKARVPKKPTSLKEKKQKKKKMSVVLEENEEAEIGTLFGDLEDKDKKKDSSDLTRF